jgi:hypothetical protein
MHFLTIVIGDDPEIQIARCRGEFDWYQFGGRWSGHLVLKPGGRGRVGLCGMCLRAAPVVQGVPARRADQAAKGDIDFTAMTAEKFAGLIADWDELEKRGTTSDECEREKFDIPESCHTRKQFEAYAQRRSSHCAPSAVICGGEWFGPWWLSDEPAEIAIEKWDAWYSSLLASLPDNTLLTVIDCHV